MKRSYNKVAVGDEIFQLDKRYSNLKLIGRGAYGSVASAWDDLRKTNVAIKRTKLMHTDISINRRIKAKRVLREVKLLRHLNAHENVITIHDFITIPSPDDNDTADAFDDTYIVLDLMESDLQQIIASSQPLSKRHHRYFLYQILRALKYIHSAHIIHRDLKPSNILVNGNCDVAICDFGLSRGISDEFNNGLTEYVVTRWYRAPEILCEASSYGKSVDIWSVGCIFAELLGRKPLLRGTNPIHQLAIIARTIACPPVEELNFVEHSAAKAVIEDARPRYAIGGGLRRLLPHDVDEDALNLLEKMLVVKPEER